MTNDTYPLPPAGQLDWPSLLNVTARLDDVSVAGRWVEPERGSDGVYTIGYAVLSDDARHLLGMLYDLQVVAPFDWSRWMRSGGRHFLEDHVLIDGANLDDCRRLLAAIARADRFNEGLYLRCVQDGTVHRVLSRVAVLVAAP